MLLSFKMLLVQKCNKIEIKHTKLIFKLNIGNQFKINVKKNIKIQKKKKCRNFMKTRILIEKFKYLKKLLHHHHQMN